MWPLLIKNMWRKTWRSTKLGSGIAGKILAGFMLLYFGAIFLVLGLFFSEMAEEMDMGKGPVDLLAKFIFYYFLFDLYIRIVFQETTDVNLAHYILHPIPRKSIIHFILSSSLISGFILMPLFFIIPFCLRAGNEYFGFIGSIAFAVSALGLIALSSYLSMYIKFHITKKQFVLIACIALFGLIGYLDYNDIVPFHQPLTLLFESFRNYSFTGLIPPMLAVGAYYLVFGKLRSAAYIDDSKNITTSEFSGAFKQLDNWGLVGDIVGLNLKMVWRNKRLRVQFIMGIAFVLYGFIAFKSEQNPFLMMIFWGLYLSGILAMQFAQYIWSYQGEYFEFLKVLPIKTNQFLKVNYYYLIAISTLTAIPSLLYYFINPAVPFIIIACYLFNIGINIPLMLFAAAYNRKKIPINEKSSFNMKGVNGTQFLVVFFILLLPIFIAIPFNVFWSNNAALTFLAFIGLMGFLLHPIIFKLMAEHTDSHKYKLTEGFRNS